MKESDKKIKKWKYIILGMIGFILTCIIVSSIAIIKAIDDNGGIKQVIIKSGKEVKDVYKQISEEK